MPKGDEKLSPKFTAYLSVKNRYLAIKRFSVKGVIVQSENECQLE
jgi:hypothetical protein